LAVDAHTTPPPIAQLDITRPAGQDALQAAYSRLSDLERPLGDLEDLAKTIFMLAEDMAAEEDAKSPILTLARLMEEQLRSVKAEVLEAQNLVHPLAYLH
jgi:hypothetical protein